MFWESTGQQPGMPDAFEAFQELLRSQEPDYQLFLRELGLKESSLSEWERVRSHILRRQLMDNKNDRWRRIIPAAQLLKRSDDYSVCGKSQP